MNSHMLGIVKSYIMSPDKPSDSEKAELTAFVANSISEAPEIIRVERDDPFWRIGDVFEFTYVKSFTRNVKDIRAGKSAGCIAWKSNDGALILIRNPKRGFDVNEDVYHNIKVPFSAASEAETMVTGAYKVVKIFRVTEPGTSKSCGYKTRMYLIEEYENTDQIPCQYPWYMQY
jgi:hypothetical protein